MGDDMRSWDGVATARALADGVVSAREVVAAAIERAEAAEPHINAFVVRTPDRALAAADAVDRARAEGRDLPLLAGVPSAVKDLSDVAGVPTRHGSRAVADFVPGVNGVEVDEFLASGLVSLGKSATPEFGFVATTEPLFCEPTRNPWDLDHSAGGSSGGAAAMVAAGVVPLAHATDGGGSIRIPAALNGLVGLKPTVDRHVRMARMERLPVKISVSNVVSRTVRDTAAHMAAVERHHRNPALAPIGHVLGPPRRRLRIGLMVDGPTHATADPLRAAVRATAGHLAAMGHDVVDVAPPVGAAFGDAFTLYWGALALAAPPLTGRALGDAFDRTQLDPFTVTLAQHARANLARLPGAIMRLRRARSDYEAAFVDVDLLLSPTVARLTPRIGETAPDREFDDLMPWLQSFAQFTPLLNVVGAPGISLPAGQHDGLPLGIQLAALPGDDRTLLEVALALEEVAPWPRLAPTTTAPVAA